MKQLLALILKELQCWFASNRSNDHKIMAQLTDLTTAVQAQTTAIVSLTTAVDAALAKGLGGVPEASLQPVLDGVNANNTAIAAQTDKLTTATAG